MRWVVYAKPPFAGPKAVLAYLSRYTHRVAISNPRLHFEALNLPFIAEFTPSRGPLPRPWLGLLSPRP
jgi:hypothetical protein